MSHKNKSKKKIRRDIARKLKLRGKCKKKNLSDSKGLFNQTPFPTEANIISISRHQQTMKINEYCSKTPSSKKDWCNMIEACELQLRENGPNCPLYNNLGLARLNLGEHDKAEVALLKAIQFKEADSITFFNLGLVYKAQKRLSLARDTYQHAIKLDPNNFKCLINLSNLLLDLRDYDGALNTYRRAHKIQPNHPNTNFMLAALEGRYVSQAPQQFVRDLFDQYAATFEQHLQDDLNYEVPSVIRHMMDRYLTNGSVESLLDLGCGTGLVGCAFADHHIKLVVGVDLSPKMLEQARIKDCYSELHTGDLLHFLQQTKLRFDFFVAADVFIYIGDLKPVLTGMRRCAKAGAIVAFSFECSSTKEIQLRHTGRFAHSHKYVCQVATETGWQLLDQEQLVLRNQRGIVDGSIVVLRLRPPQ